MSLPLRRSNPRPSGRRGHPSATSSLTATQSDTLSFAERATVRSIIAPGPDGPRAHRSFTEQDMAKKVIITCAITGSAHTPTMSSALPITPEEIAEQSIAAAEAGAAIIHLHARVPETGEPTGDPAIYARAIQRIRGASDAVINLTTGGRTTMTVAERSEEHTS